MDVLPSSSPFRVRNVQLYLFIILVVILVYSFSLGSAFDAYLLTLAKTWDKGDDRHANVFVGTVETTSGLVSLFSAVPLGYIADKVNRRRMLQSSAVLGTASVFILAIAITHDSVPLIYCGIVANSIFMQVLMSCGTAFLADCVPREQLTTVIATSSSIYLLGFSVGPLVQIALIWYVGDAWKLEQLHVFLISGFALWPLAIPPFFMLEKTPVEEGALREGLTANDATAAAGNGAAPEGDAAAEAPAAQNWRDQRVFGIKKRWFVPLQIEFCTLLTCCGAGMTVKFFPLFFKEDYKFDPISLNVLSSCTTLSIACFVQICQQVSKRVGKCQAALLWHALGTSCLYLLWWAEPLPVVVLVYLLRGAFMNAKGPIDQAIVMDCVDREYRGRWTSLQSISRFSWSGSAILGGLLADSHDYRFTFLITAIIYTTSGLMYSPLVTLVPSKEDAPRLGAGGPANGAAQEALSHGDEQPAKQHGQEAPSSTNGSTVALPQTASVVSEPASES